jgi:4-amino-4-deoxy-L-arabinose transferase-like glycosyltransferase
MILQKRLRINLFLDIATISIVAMFLYFYMPYKEVIGFNTDEGLELIKTFLFQKGYPLYQSIWSDQPPFYTYLLGIWTDVFGKSIARARELTLLFSLILLFTFKRIIFIYFGQLTSILAVFILLFSKDFIKLSSSVMQGIPSLSLGVFSLYLLIRFINKNSGQKINLIISGFLLGLAIQIKFWVLILIPVAIVTIFVEKDEFVNLFKIQKIKRKFFNVFIWSLGLLTSIGLVVWSARPFPFKQLFMPHFQEKIYENLDIPTMFKFAYGLDRIIFILAFVSLFLALFFDVNDFRKIFIPIIWLLCDFIFFWNHRPIWSHYYPMFSIPIVWLSCYSFWWGWKSIRVRLNSSTISIFLGWKENNSFQLAKIYQIKILQIIISATIVFLSIFTTYRKFNYYSTNLNHWKTWKTAEPQWNQLISSVLRYKDKSNWIYTDNSLVAIHTNLLIPPEVAVITKKRFGKSDNYKQTLLEVMKIYKPEQVILMNYFHRDLRSDPQITSYLNTYYKPVIYNSEIHHYILKNIEY